MLFNLLINGFSGNSPIDIVRSIVFAIGAILMAISIHEFSHGFIAYKLGDHTAKSSGRLSLNPFKHLNLMGTVMLLVFGFGWANPVPINPNNFKNRKHGMILTAIAGPLSNLFMCFISVFIYIALLIFGSMNNPVIANIFELVYIFSMYNAALFIFNLIPIPPLDGSKILAEILPYKFKNIYYNIERYSMYIFLALIILLNRTNILEFLIKLIINLFQIILMPFFNLFI